jgi:hypothetical protein
LDEACRYLIGLPPWMGATIASVLAPSTAVAMI